MADSKKWASLISGTASSLFAFIIVFQIPLFRVSLLYMWGWTHRTLDSYIGHWIRAKPWTPLLYRVACRNKSCESPLEVVSSHLIASEVVPLSLVKTLLYPGAIAKSLIGGSGLPNYHKLFKFYSFDEMSRASFSTDIRHLEVFAGSCLCLLGALLNLFKPRRISFIGTLLIYWGLIREILLMDSAHGWTISVRVYPTLFLASLSAFLSIRSDVRTIIRCCRSKPLSKSL